MKQVSGLPIVGKKMTREAMKALKGGGEIQASEIGWSCPGSFDCYTDEWECTTHCIMWGCLRRPGCPI